MRKSLQLFIPAMLAITGQITANPGLRAPSGMSQSELDESYKQASSLQNVFHAIYEQVRPSVVRVVIENKVQTQGAPVDPFIYRFFGLPVPRQGQPGERVVQAQGTGFVIERGLIVTNAHVVGKAKEVKIKLANGKEIKGQVKGADNVTDIALIAVSESLPVASLGDSDQLRVGDFAIAVGNPFGLDGTFTTGVVSAVGRVGLDASGGKFIQTDAAINQGNSGGPLLNLKGQVVGINRMIVSPSGGSVGIGFSIPVNEVLGIIQQIRDKGEVVRPFLGIEISPLPEDVARSSGGKGVFVSGVEAGTGAAEAGIQPGDIVLSIEKKEVNSPQELIRTITGRNAGDRVTLEIMRQGQKRSISARLGKR